MSVGITQTVCSFSHCENRLLTVAATLLKVQEQYLATSFFPVAQFTDQLLMGFPSPDRSTHASSISNCLLDRGIVLNCGRKRIFPSYKFVAIISGLVTRVDQTWQKFSFGTIAMSISVLV